MLGGVFLEGLDRMIFMCPTSSGFGKQGSALAVTLIRVG